MRETTADNAALIRPTALRGGGFNDTIIGGSGTNFISGAAGNDTITGGALRDFFAGDEGDDIIYGLAGNDFINGQAGADTITGGAGLDFIMPGDDADIVVVDNEPDFISLYSSTTPSQTDAAADTVKFMTKTGLSPTTFSNIVGFETTTAEDVLAFHEATFISGNAGTKTVVGTGSSSAAFDLNTVDFRGIVKITDNAAVDFSDVGVKIGNAVSSAAAGDAFVFLVDNGTHTLVVGWDDRTGGNANNGTMDANEFTVIALLVGVADVSVLDANTWGLCNKSEKEPPFRPR